MPWTDLFRSKKPQAAPADPAVRWFGKLPTYADYYSSRADQDWAVEFQDWLLKGYELYHSRLQAAQQAGAVPRDKAARRLPIASCALRLPRGGMTVFASIQDYGGDMQGRPFPLCFYAAAPTAQWPGPTSDTVLAAARALRDLTTLREQVIRFFNSPGRFESVFDGREVDLSGIDAESADDTWLSRAKQVSSEAWFEAFRETLQVQELAAWCGLLLAWGRNIQSNESASFEPTFRFPLAMAIPVDVQMAVWIRWLEARMDLKGRSLSLLISGEPGKGPGSLTVIAREPVPEDFLLLTPLWNTLPYLDDALRLKPSEPVPAANGAADAPAPQSLADLAAGVGVAG